MVQIVSVEKSDRKDKKMKAILDDGKIIHFGLEGSKTFIEGATQDVRDAYMNRHLGNKKEQELIDGIIPSPALFSFYLLWFSNNLQKNIKLLNRLLREKEMET